MKDGVFHQLGQPEELFRAPRDAWAARFLDAGNIVKTECIYERSSGIGPEVMVHRNAFQVAEGSEGAEARVLNCIFIEDRYELTAELNGEIIKVFTPDAFAMNKKVTLSVDENSIHKF